MRPNPCRSDCNLDVEATFVLHLLSHSLLIAFPSLFTTSTMASTWSVDEIPSDLSGKTIFITGATSGIGYEAARVFASRKCSLILACRNAEKMASVSAVFEEGGAAQVDELVCDTSDFESVRSCAEKALALPATIDVLLLNAGIGQANVEANMNTNHLGHFLLTGLLFPRLSDDARIISVSSLAHDIKEPIPWNSISADNMAFNSYAFSKLANLLFVEELNRLLLEKGSSIVAVGAHPGCTNTDIVSKLEGGGVIMYLFGYMLKNYGQPTDHGAWPLLMAATDPEVTRDCYYAPSKDTWLISEFYGPPKRNGRKGKAVMDVEAAKECWKESERLTKFEFKV